MSEKKKDLDELVIDDGVYRTRLTEKFRRRQPWAKADPRRILAQIPGTIVSVRVKAGQGVSRRQPLLVIEAMKMQNEIFCPQDGRVRAVHVRQGDVVTREQLLLELE